MKLAFLSQQIDSFKWAVVDRLIHLNEPLQSISLLSLLFKASTTLDQSGFTETNFDQSANMEGDTSVIAENQGSCLHMKLFFLFWILYLLTSEGTTVQHVFSRKFVQGQQVSRNKLTCVRKYIVGDFIMSSGFPCFCQKHVQGMCATLRF